MDEYQLNETLEIHKIFSAFRSHPPVGWWFRGQANSDWTLLPKAAREDFYLPQNRDLGRFTAWREKARAYINLPNTNWECLAIAQHYGLATRLLDWTYNPLVATYFAARECFNSDGAVYCYEPETFINIEKTPLKLEMDGVGFIPEAIDSRVIAQQSAFTVHGPPNQAITIKKHIVWEDHSNLAKIIIPKEIKKEILIHLNDYGINLSSLFPDIVGLSHHVNWLTQNMVKNK